MSSTILSWKKKRIKNEEEKKLCNLFILEKTSPAEISSQCTRWMIRPFRKTRLSAEKKQSIRKCVRFMCQLRQVAQFLQSVLQSKFVYFFPNAILFRISFTDCLRKINLYFMTHYCGGVSQIMNFFYNFFSARRWVPSETSY